MNSYDGRNDFATFSFSWSSETRSLQISKSGKKQALQSLLRNSSRGIGCGNTIYWNRMKPVDLPKEVLEAVNVGITVLVVTKIVVVLVVGVAWVLVTSIRSVRFVISKPVWLNNEFALLKRL